MTATLQRSMSIERAAFSNVAEVRRFVGDACMEVHARADERDSLELAVDEACTNVIGHGYAADSPGPVAITFESDDRELRVHIVDHGKSFRPADAPAVDTGSGWARRRPGGLGWHLIKGVVDALQYTSGADGTNRLTLIVVRRPS